MRVNRSLLLALFIVAICRFNIVMPSQVMPQGSQWLIDGLEDSWYMQTLASKGYVEIVNIDQILK